MTSETKETALELLLAARANEPDRVEFQAYFDATLDALRKGAPGLAEPSRVALSRSVALRCQAARKALSHLTPRAEPIYEPCEDEGCPHFGVLHVCRDCPASPEMGEISREWLAWTINPWAFAIGHGYQVKELQKLEAYAKADAILLKLKENGLSREE